MKKLILFIVLFLSVNFIYGQNRQIDAERVVVNDSINLVGEWISISGASNGDFIQRVAGRWINSTVSLTGWDSLTFVSSTGLLNWWLGGSIVNSYSLDGRYLLLSDTTDYVQYSDSLTTFISPIQLKDSLDIIRASMVTNETVYGITLPINGTLSGSVAAAVEGTDYPTGWVLSASGGNLQINHSLSRYASNITVFYNTTGDSYRQLRSFDNGYSGILNVDNDNLTIESISTFYTAYILNIYILFE